MSLAFMTFSDIIETTADATREGGNIFSPDHVCQVLFHVLLDRASTRPKSGFRQGTARTEYLSCNALI